jgi:hypothetical protein
VNVATATLTGTPGRVPEGTKITEREVSTLLGVSRVPAREQGPLQAVWGSKRATSGSLAPSSEHGRCRSNKAKPDSVVVYLIG